MSEAFTLNDEAEEIVDVRRNGPSALPPPLPPPLSEQSSAHSLSLSLLLMRVRGPCIGTGGRGGRAGVALDAVRCKHIRAWTPAAAHP